MRGLPANLVVRGVVALAAVLIAAPVVSVAGRFDPCCVRCKKVRVKCCCPTFCPAPMPVAVPQVTVRPQTVVTHRQVTETQYRTEMVNEQVPVTTYENVTVDEGGYQQVWVPKVVTKQVARTTVQNRMSTRTVPVQVTRTVPEYTTTYVPVGTTITSIPAATGSYLTGVPQPIPVATPVSATPVSQPGVLEPTPAGQPAPNSRLVPMPTDAGQATPIVPRSGSTTNGNSASQSRAAKSGLFQAPPSAAMVWRSQMSAQQ